MRSLFIVFCVALSFVDLFAAPLPRVGDSVDVAERNYFELFPLREGFKFALVMENERGDSNFILVNHGFPLQQSLYFLDTRAHVQLEKYLNKFEAIARGETLTDLRAIAGIISGFTKYHPKGVMLSVQRVDGTSELGRLYCIHSTAIVLAKQDKAPNWQDTTTFTIIPADEVGRIRKIGVNAAHATGWGFLIGAGVGAYVGLIATGPDDYFIQPGIAALIVGGALGCVGGVVGFMYSKFGAANKSVVNGSSERYGQAQIRFEKKASSRYLPPELRTVVNGF